MYVKSSKLTTKFYNLQIDNKVLQLLIKILNIIVDLDVETGPVYCVDICKNGSPGRPSLNIARENIEYLLQLHFSAVDMALILRVSVSTIKRRLQKYSMSITESYSSITNEILDEEILNILKQFPRTGYRRMIGFLRSKGYHIQEKRVRASMHRVDPIGILERTMTLTIIQRRKYSVKGSRFLWHIDGNHKLIRSDS